MPKLIRIRASKDLTEIKTLTPLVTESPYKEILAGIKRHLEETGGISPRQKSTLKKMRWFVDGKPRKTNSSSKKRSYNYESRVSRSSYMEDQRMHNQALMDSSAGWDGHSCYVEPDDEDDW